MKRSCTRIHTNQHRNVQLFIVNCFCSLLCSSIADAAYVNNSVNAVLHDSIHCSGSNSDDGGWSTFWWWLAMAFHLKVVTFLHPKLGGVSSAQHVLVCICSMLELASLYFCLYSSYHLRLFERIDCKSCRVMRE